MSFVRVKNKSVFLVTSYRKAGKVKQYQDYLGKAETIPVDLKKLRRLFDWSYSLLCFLQEHKDDIDSLERRSSFDEFKFQRAEKLAEKLVHHLSLLIKNSEEVETCSIHSKDLYKISVLTDELGSNFPLAMERVWGISEETYKLLKKPKPSTSIFKDRCPTCLRTS